jgi:hypothetical protein
MGFELSGGWNRLKPRFRDCRFWLSNFIHDFRDIDSPGDGLAAALDALRTDRGKALLVTSLERISWNKTELRAVASAPRSI